MKNRIFTSILLLLTLASGFNARAAEETKTRAEGLNNTQAAFLLNHFFYLVGVWNVLGINRDKAWKGPVYKANPWPIPWSHKWPPSVGPIYPKYFDRVDPRFGSGRYNKGCWHDPTHEKLRSSFIERSAARLNLELPRVARAEDKQIANELAAHLVILENWAEFADLVNASSIEELEDDKGLFENHFNLRPVIGWPPHYFLKQHALGFKPVTKDRHKYAVGSKALQKFYLLTLQYMVLSSPYNREFKDFLKRPEIAASIKDYADLFDVKSRKEFIRKLRNPLTNALLEGVPSFYGDVVSIMGGYIYDDHDDFQMIATIVANDARKELAELQRPAQSWKNWLCGKGQSPESCSMAKGD